MRITKEHYIKRLHDLIPSCTYEGRDKISIDSDGLILGASLLEEISDKAWNYLSDLPQTDYVLEIKDCVVDISCLGRFLTISLEQIMGVNDGHEDE